MIFFHLEMNLTEFVQSIAVSESLMILFVSLSGFCCGCQNAEDSEYLRGGRDCATNPKLMTAHCFKYHPLWLDFSIERTYDYRVQLTISCERDCSGIL